MSDFDDFDITQTYASRQEMLRNVEKCRFLLNFVEVAAGGPMYIVATTDTELRVSEYICSSNTVVLSFFVNHECSNLVGSASRLFGTDQISTDENEKWSCFQNML